MFEIIVQSFVYNSSLKFAIVLMEYCMIVSYTQDKATVLHYAAEGGSTSLIERCINAGINVNVVDKVNDFIAHMYV